MKTPIKTSLKIRWIITGAALLLTAAVIIPAKLSVEFSDLYAFNIYPVIVGVFSRISGLVPFSLAEIVLVLASLTAMTAVVWFIVRLIRPKGKRLPIILSGISTAAMVLSLIVVMFVYNCGVNYYRSPFSAYSGLTVEKYSKQQLYETLQYMTEKSNSLVPLIETDGEGRCVLPADMTKRAVAAMENIAKKYPALSSYYPPPKPVLASPVMCYTEITGFFAPYTMEANYNTCDTAENLGFTVCHELSHMTGFMREDEANFIAYIACRESGDPYLMYSGCQRALKSLLNSYYPEASREEYAEAYLAIDPLILKQFVMNNEFWSRYDTPVAEVSEAINNTYLVINNQSDGTKSYGRMVDLVIAEYLQSR